MGRDRGAGLAPVARAAFGVLLVGAAALFLSFTRATAPFSDEWLWALQRRGDSAATFLSPYNGHLSLVPVSIYKALWATVGLASYVPYRVMVTALVLVCATLVFAYARRRVGDGGALVAGGLILFYGPGWQDILWPFQIGWLGSVAGGLIALIALDHRSRRAEIAACLGLVLSLASSGVGAAIAAGLTVDVLARRDRRRRAWIVVGPVVLYAIWWVTEQKAALRAGSASHTPQFVAHMLAAGLSGLIGLWHAAPADQAAPVGWRIALVALAALALVGGLLRRFSLRALVLAGTGVLFAITAGVNRAGLSPGVDSRYLLIVAVFAVLCVVEMAAGRSWSPAAGAAITGVAAIICVVNLGPARQAGGFLREQAAKARADIAALALSGDAIPPGYIAQHFPGYPYIVLPAAQLLTAVHALAFPVASPAELLGSPEAAREVADGELSLLEHVAPRGTGSIAAASSGRGCTRVNGRQSVRAAALGTGGRSVTLPAAGVIITNHGTVTVIAARRFATLFANTGLIGHDAMLVRARPDHVALAWQLRIAPTATATVCPL
jgi:hypothetical protein